MTPHYFTELLEPTLSSPGGISFQSRDDSMSFNYLWVFCFCDKWLIIIVYRTSILIQRIPKLKRAALIAKHSASAGRILTCVVGYSIMGDSSPLPEMSVENWGLKQEYLPAIERALTIRAYYK